jgi:hypothetical protein
MPSNSLAACYRLYAATCIEAARNLEANRKLLYLDMAQAWVKLAEQIDHGGNSALFNEAAPSQPAKSDS